MATICIKLHKTGQIAKAQLQKVDPKCIVEFLPTEDFDWSFGFDWMREGKEGDDNVNFNKDCTTAAALRINNYKAQEIDFNDWTNPLKEKKYRYDSWLALYPPNNEDYGTTEATLRLSVFYDEDFQGTLKVKFESKFFKITPTTFSLPQKSNQGSNNIDEDNRIFIEESININCIAPFSEEQTIKVLTEHNEEIGCLRVVPNEYRYKLKMQIVKVVLLKEDESLLENNVSLSDNMQEILSKGALRHCFVRPIINNEIITLDLSELEEDIKSNIKNEIILETNKKETFLSIDYFYEKLYLKIQEKFIDIMNKISPDTRGYDSALFIINHNIARFETKQIEGKIEQFWKYTVGTTTDRFIIITPKGMDVETIHHETLHSIGLKHTFDKSNKYSFIENKTDNIMDYSPINSNKSLKATYKWQWEEVHKVAEEIRYLENEINKQ
jgi:hypothetical protein